MKQKQGKPLNLSQELTPNPKIQTKNINNVCVFRYKLLIHTTL